MWDRTPLPTLRPKNEDGLPVASSQGIVLFRFHVDEEVIRQNPVWSEGLYDDPPIPEGDALLPQLNQVMDTSVYQHLRPLVKHVRESCNIARLAPDVIQEVLDRPDDVKQGTINNMMNAFADAQPISGSLETTTNNYSNLDLSLEALVTMTQNSFMTTNPLANQLALYAMEPHQHDYQSLTTLELQDSYKPKPGPGSSQQARKMGKRTASEAPGGAVEPVPKKIKGQPYTWQAGQEAPDKDLTEDAGFVYGL